IVTSVTAFGTTVTGIAAVGGDIGVMTNGSLTTISPITTTANGKISLTAQNGAETIVAPINTNSIGNVNLSTTGVGTVIALAATITTGGQIIMNSSGSIIDDNDNSTVLNADFINMAADGDIGQPGALAEIDTSANNLIVSANNNSGGTHGIWIENTGALTVTNASTVNGVIFINGATTTPGSMTVVNVVANGTGSNVRLQTLTGGDITVGTITAAGDQITVTSAGSIFDDSVNTTQLTADTLNL